MMAEVFTASTTAPVNIAVIKYWGKRDVKLNLPTNSSISVTLSQDDLRALTTAACSAGFLQDRLWLNKKEEVIEPGGRLAVCLQELRRLRRKQEVETHGVSLSGYKLHIASENNFPTAAGLASSAAGFAALVRAVADLYELNDSIEDLSRIARQGSGSACRSLMGGYVAWDMGKADDGSDSQAVQIATRDHWPEMRACILVASAQKKDVSSTSGMQSTTKTSELFNARVDTVVPARMDAMKSAILARDFATFAELTMRDSNQFHAVCLDTYPPIFYMNDISRAAVKLVEHINAQAKEIICAYTYDAGPNTVIYYLSTNEDKVLPYVGRSIASSIVGAERFKEVATVHVPTTIQDTLKAGLTRVILTSVGPGPQKTDNNLLNATGIPC